jgi:hypothetical protein
MKLFTKKKNILLLLALILSLGLIRSEEITYTEMETDELEVG